MKIAGLQSLSLVDYPGHLASIIFTQGCNFRCGYCYNVDLMKENSSHVIPEDEVLRKLETAKKIAEGVVITGGEPTIQMGLVEFASKIKELNLKIKLDTNGSNPSVLRDLIRMGLVDYIAIDIKTSFPKYPLFIGRSDMGEKVLESLRLTMLSTVEYEFRTTYVPGMVDEADFEMIGEEIKGAQKYYIQQFLPANTYEKKFLEIKPHSPERLEKAKRILERFVRSVEIRGAAKIKGSSA